MIEWLPFRTLSNSPLPRSHPSLSKIWCYYSTKDISSPTSFLPLFLIRSLASCRDSFRQSGYPTRTRFWRTSLGLHHSVMWRGHDSTSDLRDPPYTRFDFRLRLSCLSIHYYRLAWNTSKRELPVRLDECRYRGIHLSPLYVEGGSLKGVPSLISNTRHLKNEV